MIFSGDKKNIGKAATVMCLWDVKQRFVKGNKFRAYVYKRVRPRKRNPWMKDIRDIEHKYGKVWMVFGMRDTRLPIGGVRAA